MCRVKLFRNGRSDVNMLFSETREDRTKRLFRHYTVGSYDNYTSYR